MTSSTDHVAPRPWQVMTTYAILVLAVVGTALGLFRPGFYSDPYSLVYQAYGQDAVTLVVVIPLLAIGLVLARRGSLRGYVLWLGALAYMLYTYAVYAVITQFNVFFLGYVALFGLSLYTLVGGLLRLDPEPVERRLESDLSVRPLVGFLLAMAGLVSLLWLSEIVPALLGGTKPASAAEVGLPANVVHVLDLGVLIPAMAIAAYWLRQRRAWGYVLPGILFVKLSSIGLAILAMVAWLTYEGNPVPSGQIVVFVLLTVANVGFGVWYLSALGPDSDASTDSTARSGVD